MLAFKKKVVGPMQVRGALRCLQLLKKTNRLGATSNPDHSAIVPRLRSLSAREPASKVAMSGLWCLIRAVRLVGCGQERTVTPDGGAGGAHSWQPQSRGGGAPWIEPVNVVRVVVSISMAPLLNGNDDHRWSTYEHHSFPPYPSQLP